MVAAATAKLRKLKHIHRLQKKVINVSKYRKSS